MEVSVVPSRSVHLTQTDLGETVYLKPSKGYQPEGVSFSPTIRQALEGIPYYYTDDNDWKERRKFIKEGHNDFHVYTPIKETEAIIPETIDDYERTRERRVLGKVKARKIGTIRVSIKNNQWHYDWIDKERPKHGKDWWDDDYYKNK